MRCICYGLSVAYVSKMLTIIALGKIKSLTLFVVKSNSRPNTVDF